jgi:hypothetical protein
MDADADARHRSGLWAIISVAPPRLMNGASHAPLTNHADPTQCFRAECYKHITKAEREVDSPATMRRQKAFAVSSKSMPERQQHTTQCR